MTRLLSTICTWVLVTPLIAHGAPSALDWNLVARVAYRSDPKIQKSALAVKTASQNYGLAEVAPNVNAVIATTQDLYGGDGFGVSETVSISQALFPILFANPNLEEAAASFQKSQADFSITSATVRLDLATAFISLWANEKSVDLANKIVTRRQKNMELISARFNVGREHAGSKAWAGAQLSSAKNDLVRAEREVLVSRRRLQLLMGPYAQILDNADPSIAPLFSVIPPSPNVDQILAGHPKLRSAAANTQVKIAGQRTVAIGNLPSVSGALTTAHSGKSGSTEIGMSAQVSIPLYSGRAPILKEEIAATAVDSAEADTRAVRQALESDLRRGWTDLQNAKDDLATQRLFLEASQTRSEIAAAQYSSGLLSYENWDLIETEVINQLRQVLARQKTMALTIATWDSVAGKELEQ